MAHKVLFLKEKEKKMKKAFLKEKSLPKMVFPIHKKKAITLNPNYKM